MPHVGCVNLYQYLLFSILKFVYGCCSLFPTFALASASKTSDVTRSCQLPLRPLCCAVVFFNFNSNNNAKQNQTGVLFQSIFIQLKEDVYKRQE